METKIKDVKQRTFGYLRMKNLRESRGSSQNCLNRWFHGPPSRWFPITEQRFVFSCILQHNGQKIASCYVEVSQSQSRKISRSQKITQNLLLRLGRFQKYSSWITTWRLKSKKWLLEREKNEGVSTLFMEVVFPKVSKDYTLRWNSWGIN